MPNRNNSLRNNNQTLSIMQQAEQKIDQAEREQRMSFTTEEKNLIVNYAFKLDDLDKTDLLISNLMDAKQNADGFVENVKELAQAEIDDLPDPMIGLSEMHQYGYPTEENNMLPLSKEAAKEYFDEGIEIFALYEDGSEAVVESRQQLEEHQGLFGIEEETLQLYRNPPDIDYEMLQDKMTLLQKQEALEIFDQGFPVYQISTSMQPSLITTRSEIELGDDYFQMSIEEYQEYQHCLKIAELNPNIESVREARLFISDTNRFGIYQLKDGIEGRDYRFMSYEFTQRNGMQIQRADYNFIYSGQLFENETLDSIYERFNINHPSDYRGHSLSVSDIVVLQKNGNAESYYVDSFGFQELPDFVLSKDQMRGIDEASITENKDVLDEKDVVGAVPEVINEERMKEADALAIELHDFFRDYDPYEYADAVEEPEKAMQDIADRLKENDPSVQEWLQETMDEAEGEELEELQLLYKKVNDLYERRDKSTLAKVEEQLEQNYNMIDDLINNEPPKKENAYLEFYVAQCQEFHDMGLYVDGLSLPEAIERYKEIREDPRNSYLGNGMGFIIHDKEMGIYDETEYPLVNGDRIDGQMLDSVPAFVRHPLIRQAVENLREAFPEYQYTPCMEVKESYYPEIMTAEMIAVAVTEIYISSVSELHKTYPKLEIEKDNVYYDMLAGNKKDSMSFLNQVMDEIPSQKAQAEVLKDRIKEYQQENVSEIAPFVKITFSEYEGIRPKYYPLSEIDQTIQNLDKQFSNQSGIEELYQLRYTVCYIKAEKVESIDGRMNIGDGEGGIVDHLQAQTEMKLYDNAWQSYMKNHGEKQYEKVMADLTDMQEHVLPYLQSFVSLQEKEPVKTIEAKGKESTAVKQEVPKLQGKEKLSIHEKLERNKEVLASKTGSMAKEKGVELG